jgi:hypothetical protein
MGGSSVRDGCVMMWWEGVFGESRGGGLLKVWWSVVGMFLSLCSSSAQADVSEQRCRMRRRLGAVRASMEPPSR